MEQIADLFAVVVGRAQAAHLEDQLRVAEIHDRDLRVRRLSLVLVAEATAQADHALGERGAGNAPAGDVHLMHALIADVAIAGVPEPVPVIGHEILMIRLLRRWSEPQIEIQLLRRIAGLLEADAATRLVAQGTGNQQLAGGAGTDEVDRAGPAAARAALRAVLHDATVLARGLDGDPPFVNVVAARLFDVHVLVRGAGPDRHQRMPVVGRSDRDGVEVRIVQRLADVADLLRLVAGARLDRSAREGLPGSRVPNARSSGSTR